MALLGSRAAKKSREKRRTVREEVANEARTKVEKAGGSPLQIQRAGQLAADNYEEYNMKAGAVRSYQAFYAEHGREATAVLSAAAAVGGAIHPVLGVALAASAAAAAAQTQQEERLADARQGEREEMQALLTARAEDFAAVNKPPEAVQEEKPPSVEVKKNTGTLTAKAQISNLWARFAAWFRALNTGGK